MTVDTQTCDHHGQCMIACPEVFNLVAPDRLEYVAEPDESLRDLVEEAEAACPTLSIMIEDESQNPFHNEFLLRLVRRLRANRGEGVPPDCGMWPRAAPVDA